MSARSSKMVSFVGHVIRGCGTLPHCGSHPGTVFLALMVLMGAAAGSKGGALGMFGGAGVMLVFGGAFYLVGAYSRSKTDEELEARLRAKTR
ncbi:hypothetical protein [Oleiharenicola sp. Vm1]|uniref:hypothetical protein n=1 Tax=Oleiharenicola sp. Vm1 TaxID=3398393 RepID=UPI0039F53749